MIICIDCDNVLNNLQETVIKIFNKRYSVSYNLNDFKHYRIAECLNKNDTINFVKIYSEKGIYDLVSPLNGAQNAINKLKKQGHEVYVVTDAIPSIFEEKVNWIKFHFPNIDENHIICMKHKWLFKCDIMLDDNLDNLLGGHHYDRVCFDYSWNRATRDEVYGIHRVNNWNDALNTINKISQKWSDDN